MRRENSSNNYKEFYAEAKWFIFLNLHLVLKVYMSSSVPGINITLPMSTVVIEYANITQNRGYGIYVNASRCPLRRLFTSLQYI
jgi:hypothetical protein